MLKNEKERVWIDHVPVLILGMQKDTSYIGAIESGFSVMGICCKYNELMAVSAVGLTTKWFCSRGDKKWGGDALPGIFDEELDYISAALGVEFSVYSGEFDRQKVKERLVESINRSIPVFCLDRGTNLAVVFGYESAGGKVWIRPYIDASIAEKDWDAGVCYDFDQLAPYFIFIEAPNGGATPINDQAIIQGVQKSQSSFHRKPQSYKLPFYKEGVYYFGKEAYQKWIEDLKDIEKYSDAQVESLKFFTWWNEICILDRRTAMVSVFRNLASAPSKTDTSNKFVEAARLCTKQCEILRHRTWANTYDSDVFIWKNQVSEEILFIQELAAIEKELFEVLLSIEDWTNY